MPLKRYESQDYRRNRLFCPERNVVMSALTETTIIVEAGQTSGTLIQARAALQQGRRLFVLDSCFRNPHFASPARLAAQGAVRSRITMASAVAFPDRFTEVDELTRPDHFWLTDEDRCYFLGECAARQGYAYSPTNDLILNFKKPADRRGRTEWRYKERTFRRAATAFRSALGAAPPAMTPRARPAVEGAHRPAPNRPRGRPEAWKSWGSWTVMACRCR